MELLLPETLYVAVGYTGDGCVKVLGVFDTFEEASKAAAPMGNRGGVTHAIRGYVANATVLTPFKK